MAAYYNENDPYAAEWLRNLIAAGHIAPGDVDERSIIDVHPDDLKGYTQCHFFAGIGVWSYALRLAGWPDTRPVWTGSCPCQPFSSAGKGDGFADERHLWPHWFHLIEQCRPPVIFGEQVASKDGLGWLDLVQADLEGADYASAAVDICAAGVGAPHIRQRLWFVAERLADASLGGRREERADVGGGAACGLGHPGGEPGQRNAGSLRGTQGECGSTRRADGHLSDGHSDASDAGGLEHAGGGRRQRGQTPTPGHVHDREAPQRAEGEHGAGVTSPHRLPEHGAGPTNGFWRDADWLLCRDGKWRPVEPGTFPLAHGATARVGRLRAYGNAIVPQVAAEVIGAYLDGEWLL